MDWWLQPWVVIDLQLCHLHEFNDGLAMYVTDSSHYIALHRISSHCIVLPLIASHCIALLQTTVRIIYLINPGNQVSRLQYANINQVALRIIIWEHASIFMSRYRHLSNALIFMRRYCHQSNALIFMRRFRHLSNAPIFMSKVSPSVECKFVVSLQWILSK